jgi:hypothetical protein
MVYQGRGSYPSGFQINNFTDLLNGTLSPGFGLKMQVFFPFTTSLLCYLNDGESSGVTAGDYFSIPYTSLARCAVVDNGQNYLLRSDEMDNVIWSSARVTFPSQQLAPDGTTTAEFIREDSTASSTHLITQSRTVATAANDFCLTAAVKPNGRTWVALAVHDGSNEAICYFNLSTGAVGTSAQGASWTNLRAFTASMGNGFYQCCVVARKTSASTTVDSRIYLASADNTNSYSGGGASGIIAWRATLSQSSVPVRLVQTVGTAFTSGTAQSGSGVYTKGWPASTSGLLLTGDWIDINGELKQLTAPVTSDALGLAYIQFRPGLGGSPSDNDAVVAQEPFGRFIYPGTREFENLFGIYGDCEMNLEEIYS